MGYLFISAFTKGEDSMNELNNKSEIKEQICDICHKMWQLGWVAANDGNVSVRLSDGSFLTTPTGISKSFITPDKLVRINAEGKILEAAPGYSPSSEIKMHLRCYREREDVNGVVHAHPPTATGYAVAGLSLDDYSMIETVIAIGSVPLTPYGTPSTMEVPEAITPYLQKHDVLLLQNHGALAVGNDVYTAYYRMETLELFAKISLTAHLLGSAKEIPKAQIDKLLALRESRYHMTGRHPGYKKYNSRKADA
jgi:L-fuculose-phosphate aldolase